MKTLILAGSGRIEHDEHGPYRQLLGYRLSHRREVVCTLRWNGERWARGASHRSFASWMDAIHESIAGAVAGGFITPVTKDFGTGKATTAFVVNRVVSHISVIIKQET